MIRAAARKVRLVHFRRRRAVILGILRFLADVHLALAPFLPAAIAAAAEPPRETAISKKAGVLKENDYGLPQVRMINEAIRQGWLAGALTHSPAATDGEWCRRVYLDILGRIPTIDELNKFLADSSGDRKLKLVNRLLGDEYVEQYARNWTNLWTNLLVGRSGGTTENSLTDRVGLQQALRRAFVRNMPYDRLVHELVASRGVNKPGTEGFNGFVNYLADKLDDHAVQATAKTSQIFLGLQIQCTQCHNHPFNDWRQNRFWEMNAFFRQTRALRRYEGGQEVKSIELTNQDFPGENNQPEEAALFYEERRGTTAVAYPVFIDGAKLKSDSGYLQDVDRRTELANLIVKSEYMPKTIVNRMWAHFLGYGFTKPVDDMGPHNPPSHPELLAGLAREFQTRSHDLKELIRWITLSEAYSLSSRLGEKNKKDDPALGERPAFSHFYLRQMRAEELYESLLAATLAHQTRGAYEEQEAAKREWLSQFTIAFGTDDNDETTTFNGTIPQALMMMNGDLIKKAIGTEKGSFLAGIAADRKLNNAAKINYLYLAALARRPTAQEISLANQLLALWQGDPTGALQDVWWALLNSNEFILNH